MTFTNTNYYIAVDKGLKVMEDKDVGEFIDAVFDIMMLRVVPIEAFAGCGIQN